MSDERGWTAPIVSEMTLRELRGTLTKKARMYYIEARDSHDPEVGYSGRAACNAYADAAALVLQLCEPGKSYDDCWEKCRADIAAGIQLHDEMGIDI